MREKLLSGGRNKIVLKKVTVALELISKSFLNPMAKANEKMKEFNGQLHDTSSSMKHSSMAIQNNQLKLHSLNKTLVNQQQKYNKVGVEMSKVKERLIEIRGGTRKLSASQKSQIDIQNKTMAGLRQQSQAISSRMSRTKGQIMTNEKSTRSLKDGMVANMGFLDVMRLTGDQFKETGKRQHLMTKGMGKFAFRLRKGLHGLRGFKMEMLGVMFFGMSMIRMFGGLIETSTQWTGVWEIMSMALGILFLPLAMKLQKWAIKFLKWVTELTPKQKKWLNIMVAAGIAVGILLTFIGTLVLGLGSLVLAFGFLFSPLGMVITAFATIAGFSFLNGMFSDVGDAVGFMEEKLIAMGVSADAITLVKDKLAELFFSLSTMTEEWVAIGVGIADKLVQGIVLFFKENPLMIVGAIAGAFLGGPAGVAMGVAIGSLFKKLKMEDIKELVDSGLKILDQIILGVVNNLEELELVVETIASMLTQFAIDHIDEFVEIGITIGKAIVRGIMESFSLLGALKGAALAFVTTGFNPIAAGAGFVAGGFTLGDKEEENRMASERKQRFDIARELTTSKYDVTNNYYGFTLEDLKRELDERDSKMVAQMEANR